MEDSLWG